MAEQAANKDKGFAFPGGKPAAFGLLAVLCVAGAGGGYFLATGMGGGEAAEMPKAAAHQEEPADDGHGEPKVKPKNEMAVTPFKEIIVNINATTATGRTTSRFMKLNVALVYDEGMDGSDRIEERRLFIRDSFQDYLRQLNEQDIQGSLGLVIIKQELLHRARTVTESMSPREILVADMIVQ